MIRLPAIDLHTHVEPGIAASDLLELQSLLFVATRSMDETQVALERTDALAVWGVGCHPGLVRNHKKFDADRFAELIRRTAYVSEVGLDGSSRVPLVDQKRTLRAILEILQSHPRIVSLHSNQATEEVLDLLSARPIEGAVLHWWLGDATQTKRALELGCYFSINFSGARRRELLELLPLDRVLTETDHPFGDRFGRPPRRPGSVQAVEDVLGKLHGLTPGAVRVAMWQNLLSLSRLTQSEARLPGQVRKLLITVPAT